MAPSAETGDAGGASDIRALLDHVGDPGMAYYEFELPRMAALPPPASRQRARLPARPSAEPAAPDPEPLARTGPAAAGETDDAAEPAVSQWDADARGASGAFDERGYGGVAMAARMRTLFSEETPSVADDGPAVDAPEPPPPATLLSAAPAPAAEASGALRTQPAPAPRRAAEAGIAEDAVEQGALLRIDERRTAGADSKLADLFRRL